MHEAMAATLDTAVEQIKTDSAGDAARSQAAITDPAALADDRPQFAKGLDRAEDGRRPADRRHVPLAPGAAVRSRRTHPEHLQAARGLAEELPAGGALR